MTLQKTALHHVHRQLGAKMVPFAGYEMPLRYTSDLEEHRAVRERVGIFDVSHMGEFLVQGPNALDLLQKITSNDVSKLYDGKAQYSALVNREGGVVDDLIVYRITSREYMLVVNAANIEKDWKWINDHNAVEAELHNVSEGISLFAVQGPYALSTCQPLTVTDLEALENYTFEVADFAGAPNAIISATGYTGAGGFELYVPNASAEAVWNAILDSGKVYGIRPVGLGARDTLRLEMGYCLYGNDLNDECSPLEAGLGWITKLNKEFVGSDKIKALKERGLERRLVGFIMEEKGIPRPGYEICTPSGEAIGKVTSGSQSPTLGVGIGMGYVQTAHAKAGTEIAVRVGDRLRHATVRKFPLISATGKSA